MLLGQEVDGGFGDDVFATDRHGWGRHHSGHRQIRMINQGFKDVAGIVLEGAEKDNIHEVSISPHRLLLPQLSVFLIFFIFYCPNRNLRIQRIRELSGGEV